MSNWIKLGDLKERLQKFAESKELKIGENKEYRKIGLLCKKDHPGTTDIDIKHFFKIPHIAIYETNFLFGENENENKDGRILFVVSVDNCHKSIKRCDRIGCCGFLIGGVISRPKKCIYDVWKELSLLLDKAYEEFSKNCPCS